MLIGERVSTRWKRRETGLGQRTDEAKPKRKSAACRDEKGQQLESILVIQVCK